MDEEEHPRGTMGGWKQNGKGTALSQIYPQHSPAVQ